MLRKKYKHECVVNTKYVATNVKINLIIKLVGGVVKRSLLELSVCVKLGFAAAFTAAYFGSTGKWHV